MNNKLKCLALFAIIILLIGGVSRYFWGKKGTLPLASVSHSPTTSLVPTPPPEVWETYTNSELGFSIKYPRMVYGVYRCEPSKPFYVPVKIFEDNKNAVIYITQEYYYQAPYSEELKDYTEPCEKITYSLESLKSEEEKTTFFDGTHYQGWKPFWGWEILTSNVKNSDALNKFIKNNYGTGCFIGNKKPWNQGGVYEIEIRGEDWGKKVENTSCSLMYSYKILYAPEKNKVISVKLGQECTFDISPTDSKDYQCYDNEMIGSLRLE